MGETLARAGFSHYEVSNWALPGQESRHNVKYWKRTPTLGLGVSAHEFWNGRRRANVSSLPRYIEEMTAGRRPVAMDDPVAERGGRAGADRARPSPVRRSPERRIWNAASATRGDATLPEDYESWKETRLLIEEDPGRIRLSERGFLVSNEVLCRFV